MKFKTLLILIFAVIYSTIAFGQSPVCKVTGKVINGLNGEPIANASVSFQYGGPGPNIMLYIEPVMTGQDGSYSISLQPAVYYLIVKHPEFDAYLNKEVKISSDTTLDFKLQPYKPPVVINNYVKGTVLDNQTSQPVVDCAVSLLASDGRKIYIGTASDSQGSFILSNIPEGGYYVNASKRGYIQYKDTTKLSINENTKIEGLKINLRKDSTYTNDFVKSVKFFVYKTDSSGSRLPLPDAKILLVGPDGTSYKGITDKDGVFILAEALTGFYKVMVSLGDKNEYTSVEIKTDNQTFEIEVKEPAPVAKGTIKGKVYSNSDSSPIEGASVYVLPSGGKPADPVYTILPYFGSTTDKNGEYSFTVTPGDYVVICAYVDKNGCFSSGITEYYDDAKSIQDAKIITVAKDAVVSGINFGLDKPVTNFAEVTVSGMLLNSSGQVVKEAKLVIYDKKNDKQIGAYAKTGADGKYYAAVILPKGENEIVIGAYGINYQVQFYNGKSSLYEADIVKINITADKAEINNIDFRLSPYSDLGSYSISGRVVDDQMNPVIGAYVELYGSFNKSISAVTDSLGNYIISGLPKGKYIVGFFAKGYVPQFYKDALTWEKAASVELTSDIKGIDAVLKKMDVYPVKGIMTGCIAGRVQGKDNSPISGARVILTSADGTLIAADVSNSLGEYSLSGFTVGGSYKIIASRVDYQSIESPINMALDMSVNNTYNINLTSAATAVEDRDLKPSKYILENNYPNPFNPSTRIRFALPEAARVRLEVYSIVGQKIATLADDYMSAGYHEVTFNASGLASGIYLYRMSTESFAEVKTMFLLK